MASANIIESDLFTYLILPAFIFLARISDVTLGTIRIIQVSRGNKLAAPLLGFFEVLIWIFVISNIVQRMNNIYAYLAYAGGFATGNYIGLRIEEKLAMGVNLIRVFIKKNADQLMSELHEKGYGATVLNARGKTENVSIIYTIVKRKEVSFVVELIEKMSPHAFYTIEDIRYISHEDFSSSSKAHPHHKFSIIRRWRVGK